MNADEVRLLAVGYSTSLDSILRELAAQLAEANEHLAKLANPLMVVNAQSLWVAFWLTNGKRINFYRGSVMTVSEGNGGDLGIGLPTCFITAADREVYTVKGNYLEVCAKLGIPTTEGS